MPCVRPAACEDLAPSSDSSGAMKTWNRSSDQRVGPAELRAHRVVDDRAENQRAATLRRGVLVDPPQYLVDLFRRVDEWNRLPVEAETFELRQQAVAEHFGGDAGPVGDEKYRAPVGHPYQSFHTGTRPAGSGGMSPRSAQPSPGP